MSNMNLMQKGHKEIKAKLFKFMPIEKAILSMVVRNLPSPVTGQPRKIDSLAVDFKNKTRVFLPCRDAIISCSQTEPIIVYVTKM